MRIRWFGQSAFLIAGSDASVMLDPIGDTAAFRGRVRFDYPPVTGVAADLVLVTHDHRDHGVAGIEGDPAVIRVAGTHASPVGEVVGVAGEHDDVAGTRRGPNTLFSFALDGIRVAHLGDHGQSVLRPEQAVALGPIDLLFVPVGGGPTVGAEGAATIVERLDPRWVVPMHYRTPAVDFLDPVDPFLERFEAVTRCEGAEVEVPGAPNGVLALTPPRRLARPA
jgi:L-ascorbate metabolism protein UlaG (beta-lactamase superfamily)